MPWPKDHKAKTREKIVGEAAKALRTGGTAGVGVDEVMRQVGLTHGAFYAHFESKDDLLRAALDQANAETLERFEKQLEPLDPEARFAGAVAAYLSPLHLAHPEFGCPVAAVGPEMTREGAKSRRVLGDGIRKRIEWLRGLLPKRLRGPREDEVLVGTLACMVGAIVLARSVGKEEGAQILENARKFVERGSEPR